MTIDNSPFQTDKDIFYYNSRPVFEKIQFNIYFSKHLNYTVKIDKCFLIHKKHSCTKYPLHA